MSFLILTVGKYLAQYLIFTILEQLHYLKWQRIAVLFHEAIAAISDSTSVVIDREAVLMASLARYVVLVLGKILVEVFNEIDIRGFWQLTQIVQFF